MSNTEANSPEKFLDDDFKQWIQSLMDEYHVPGWSVAIVHDGMVEAEGYGLARFPDVPATADTIYVMASTTKAFAAALMGLLINESVKLEPSSASSQGGEKLAWCTPMKSILGDDFLTKEPYLTANITIEDILSHRTGFPGHDLIWGPWLEKPADVTRLIRHLDSNSPFRSKYQYNNICYSTVGHAVEVLTGQDLSTALRERIFDPLGMRKTFLGPEEASRVLETDHNGELQFARGYHWVSESQQSAETSSSGDGETGYYVADPHTSTRPLDSAGANMSTVADYAKWISALLKASTVSINDADKEGASSSRNQEPRIISNNLWKELTTPRSFWPPGVNIQPLITEHTPNAHVSGQAYALGWMNDPYMYPGQIVVQHSGGIPSFGAQVTLLPDHHFGVVAVGNTAGTSNQVCDFAVKELLGRRLGVSKEERRRRFDKKAQESSKENDKPCYNASEPGFARKTLKLTDRPIEAEESLTQSTTSSIFFLSNDPVHLPKTISHPAYGSYYVSLAPATVALPHPRPSVHGSPIIRKNPKISKSGVQDDMEQSSHTILVRSVGNRGIKYEHALHPSAVVDDKLIYDLEQLERHGLPNTSLGDLPDPFSSLPAGHGTEDDKKYPYRDTQVWTSAKIAINGGVVVLTERVENGRKSFVVEKLGLRFARIDEVKGLKNGVLEEGWDTRLVWFTPVDV